MFNDQNNDLLHLLLVQNCQLLLDLFWQIVCVHCPLSSFWRKLVVNSCIKINLQCHRLFVIFGVYHDAFDCGWCRVSEWRLARTGTRWRRSSRTFVRPSRDSGRRSSGRTRRQPLTDWSGRLHRLHPQRQPRNGRYFSLGSDSSE